MSVILSYSDNTTGSGWVMKDPYSGDDIRKIDDPNGDTVEQPRTAIPSPFAQVDLVLTSFEALAANGLHGGTAMHHRLVSNALDIAQLLFDFPNHAAHVRFLRWNPQSAMAAMEQGSNAHRLLAETLRLYFDSDDKAYNFHDAGDWYILLSEGRVIGSTSPATLTMGAPGCERIDTIMLEQGCPLFGTPRHLWERDEEFVLYLVHWFGAYPQVRKALGAFYSYLLTNLEVIRLKRADLYSRILERVPNPSAFSPERAEQLAVSLQAMYDTPAATNAPRIFGTPLFTRRAADMLATPEESDFLLRPLIKQPAGELTPLLLREGFTPPGATPYRYINRPWQTSTKVDPADTPIEKRVLPDTSITYPWITTSDLLEDSIIELATPIAPQFFSAESRSEDTAGCLLPLKPLFFKYFPATLLTSQIVPGRPVMEMRREGSSIVVILRLPTRGGFVELQRTYLRIPAEETFTPTPETGRIVDGMRLSAAIFPFARTGERDIYNVRLFEMMPSLSASLSFHADGREEALPGRTPFVRTRSRAVRTAYYEVEHTWDYSRLSLQADTDPSYRHSGVILPLWPAYNAGADEHTFAIDFGTTNSHVEYCVNDAPPRPLTFDSGSAATLVATLEAPGSLAQADTLLDVEFLPRSLGNDYGFPLRTALARNISTDAPAEALRSVNIPFLYERKPFNGYRVSTMLKWSEEHTDSEQFLRELMLLIRARVILDGGSPARTRIVYFYPVSMKRSLQHRYLSLWEALYTRYLAPGEPRVEALPESVAPAFFYHNSATAGSDFASIDIGGGSSDVVIYRADEDRLSSHPAIISSFRFAGNSLFGDAFTHADAATNPMVSRYASTFSRILEVDPQYSYLDVILSDIMTCGRSEDINAFLFSIEQAPGIRALPDLDRRRYSYNAMLSDDASLKIVFLYFYTALVYYVARLMMNAGIGLPRRICFSGTGSKILNILGRHRVVEEYTQAVIEKVFGRTYSSSQPFELKIERDSPKQVTCKGGLELDRRIESGESPRIHFSPRYIMEHKSRYTLTDTPYYTYSSVRSLEKRADIEQQVELFNSFFTELLTGFWGEEFGVSREALEKFKEVAGRDISNYLAAGIKFCLPEGDTGDEVVEDVPFFYAITGIIRNTLIPLFS